MERKSCVRNGVSINQGATRRRAVPGTGNRSEAMAIDAVASQYRDRAQSIRLGRWVTEAGRVCSVRSDVPKRIATPGGVARGLRDAA